MTRASIGLCALLAACSSDPYVIGEQRVDAGSVLDSAVPDECEEAFDGALACSGFEDDALDAGVLATTIVGSGTLERSTERAYTGHGALRASTQAIESVAVVTSDFAPVRSGMLYLRAHLFVAAAVPTETLNIFFLGDAPTPDPFTGFDINLYQGALQVFSPQFNPARQMSTALIPRDRWFCLRATILIGDAEGRVQLFVDDEAVLEATGLDTLPTNGVHLLRAGIDWSSQQAEPLEIWLDDLVLDTAPVACRDQ